MDLQFILVLLALICAVAAAFGITTRHVNLTAASLAFYFLSLLV